MILADPKCSNCKGDGVVGCLPCGCTFEPNNCDRCATLQCGEERAPSSRWAPLGASADLCDRCRREIGLPKPLQRMSREDLLAAHVALLAAHQRLLQAVSEPAAMLATISLSVWRKYLESHGWVKEFESSRAELWHIPGRDRCAVWAPWYTDGSRSEYSLTDTLGKVAASEARAPAVVLADLMELHASEVRAAAEGGGP